MNKELVIFDLDGTLLNTLEDLVDSTNFALKYFNFPTRSVSEVRNFVGNGVSKLIERAIPNGLNNEDFNQCLEIFKNHYSKNMCSKTKPYEGVIELLQILRHKEIKTAVVSNKFDTAVKNLCDKYFPSLIDYACGENEAAGICKKPATDMVFYALKHFGISKERAVYVGDSEVDIQTAKNSKMDFISVTWGFKSEEFLIQNGAKHIISKPSQILDIIFQK